jgi:peptide deformylase
MILEIQTGLDNQVLRTHSTPVTKIDRDTKKLIRDLKATIGPNNGIGLAAPQVGVHKRVILIHIPSDYFESTGCPIVRLDTNFVLINPEIIWSSSEQVLFEEGCLSLPDFFSDVLRPSRVRFRALNEKGEVIEAEAEGIFARVLQHEIDHLDGVLFADKLSPLKMKQANKVYI